MAAKKTDYYKVLGVVHGADDRTLKSAYHLLATRYHPDLNPGDARCEEKFKEVAEAYSALSPTKKRAAYDG